jgi:O-antigen/teichoic acid export membrane protein
VTSLPVTSVDSMEEREAGDAIRGQIRGSSLLLVGRLLSLAMSLVIQIMIVRALSKPSYGAFEYGLSLVTLGATLATLGLHRAVSRFVPIYEERREYDKVLGTIILAVTAVAGLGAVEVAAFFVLDASLPGTLGGGGPVGSLLPILILLAPLQALDSILVGLLAVLARARSIFLRTYVLAPGLRFVVVLVVIVSDGGVSVLAAGYVAAEVAGLAVFTAVLYRATREVGLLDHLQLDSVRIPARKIFALTIPLLTTELVYVVLIVSDALLLQHFRGPREVAELKAVTPAAGLIQVVILSFTPLFTPLASRFFARRVHDDINELYWRTASWIGVLSFPIFAVTFLLAKPLTVTAFGSRYADSAILLSILAVGFYVQSALGFNGTTLMVFGRIRYIVVVNVLTVTISLVLSAWLIWRFGALGAAIGTAAGLIVHNVLKQIALGIATTVQFFDLRYLRIYAGIAVAFAVLIAVAVSGRRSLLLDLIVAACGSAAVVFHSRRALAATETFPELLRFPLARRLLG